MEDVGRTVGGVLFAAAVLVGIGAVLLWRYVTRDRSPRLAWDC